MSVSVGVGLVELVGVGLIIGIIVIMIIVVINKYHITRVINNLIIL